MKVEFDWRDYDDYAKWLQDVLTTLYEENEQLRVEKVKLLSENQQLKKQKDDVVEYVKKNNLYHIEEHTITPQSTTSYIEVERHIVSHKNDLLRMLGEIDE